MITVQDLASPTDKTRQGEFLYCRVCGAHYSATAGDYFMANPKAEFICCGEPMVLAREHKEIVVLKE